MSSAVRDGDAGGGAVSWRIIHGDCREALATLPAGSVHCCVTSPPYWGLRDYGVDGQLGLERTPDEYVAAMVAVFREVRRILRDDGTLGLNLGDSYAANQSTNGGCSPKSTLTGGGGRYRSGSKAEVAFEHSAVRPLAHGLKPKDLVGIPWRVAFALQADGWWLRSDIIWAKPNPMPESVTDRPTKAHEYVFLLSKSERYFFDAEAVRERHAEDDRPQSESRRLQRMGRSVSTVAGGGQSSKGIDSGAVAATHTMQTNPAGRNIRTVWPIATQPFPGAHFAVMPPALAERCVKAGSPAGGTVLDPFSGAGTTGLVADRLGRSFVGIELNPAYATMARRRIYDDAPLLNAAGATA